MHFDRARMTTRTLPLVSIAALTLAGLIACFCDLALTWDGGAQFCYTLSGGRPYVYGARFFSAIVWQPVIWLAHFTDDLALLRSCYGLPLCLAPAAGAALSWWMIRRTASALYPWAVLGICVPSALAQVFVINESIFQQNLFWPVFLGLLVPLNWPRRVVLAALLVFQFSHPQGLILLAGTAAGLWLLAREKESPDASRHHTRALAVTALAALCLLRIVLVADPEAARQADIGMVFVLFWQALAGWPLVGWLCVVSAVGLLAAERSARVAAALVVLAAAAWLWWASDPQHWVKALDGRRFVVALGAPFFYGAWRSAFTGTRRRPIAPHLPLCALTLALVFLATHAVQAFTWQALMNRLLATLEADPRAIIPREELTWIRGTPLDHWALGSQVIAKLGGQKLVLDAAARAAIEEKPPRVQIGYDAWVAPAPGPLGYFDFRPALKLSAP
jgi:hypothetical protein